RGAQPLFLSSLFQLACDAVSSAPSVFYVACESIRSGMSVASSYEPLCAQQHSGALLINSAPPQECHYLDFVAHVAAQHLYRRRQGAGAARHGPGAVASVPRILGGKVGVVHVRLVAQDLRAGSPRYGEVRGDAGERDPQCADFPARPVDLKPAGLLPVEVAEHVAVQPQRRSPPKAATFSPSNQVRRCARWVISLELEGSAAYTKHSLFYGFDDVEANGARAGTETTRCSSRPALFNKNPAIRVNVVVAHIAGEEAAYDVDRSVKQGGKLLLLADWKTLRGVDERAAFEQQDTSSDIQLLVVDAVELAARVEDDGVAAVGL
ncbi:hypothetical protein PF006_g24389, partial [Phytophthora fragariae]